MKISSIAFKMFFLSNLFCGLLCGQAMDNSARVNISTGVSLVLTNINLTQSGSGEILGSGTVKITGTTAVSLNNSGTNDLTFYNLEVDNTAGILLNAPIDISNNLLLTDGIIDANTSELRFGTSATATGGGNTAHIDGFATKTGTTDFNFPVGDNGIYQHFRITTISALSTFRVSYFDVQHPQAGPYYDGTANASIAEELGNCDHWDVEQVPLGSATANVVVSYGNNSCNVIPPAGEAFMSMAVWDGLSWNYPLPGVDPIAVSGEVATTTPLSNFGGFVLASNDPSNNVLPIELLSFDATAKTTSVFTEWITATEINNDYFTVERSRDGHAFSSLENIDGAGNSHAELTYSFIDGSPLNGISYYRLRQTDFDGASTASDPVAVEFRQNLDGFSLENAFNCYEGLCIVYQSDAQELELRIYSSSGELVHQSEVSPNNNFKTIPLDISRGIYHVSLSDGRRVESRKVLM